MLAEASSDTKPATTAQDMAVPDRQDSPSHRPQPFVASEAGRWQLLAGVAGLLLASTWFAPIARFRDMSAVPFEVFRDEVGSCIRDASVDGTTFMLVLVTCAYFVAYSFGGLEALAAALRWAGRPTWSTGVSRVTHICLWIVGLSSLVQAVVEGIDRWPHCRFLAALVSGVSSLTMVYLWRSHRLRSQRWLAQSFVGSFLCFGWFTYWLFSYPYPANIAYGLPLSWIASSLLLLAAIGEAQALLRTSWPWAVLVLIISRLPEGYHQGHCPQCDYSLYGLPEPRCPECGRPFTPEEAAAAKP